VAVIGRELAGNWQPQSNPTIHQWQVDTLPPTFVISPPVSPTNATDQNITVTSISKNGTVLTARNETTGFTSISTPSTGATVTFGAFPLQTGPNRIPITAQDPAGNREETRTETYTFAANGDVDGDGLIDILDILRGLSLITGTSQPTEGERRRLDVAPLDHTMKPAPDGVIDLRDVILITRRAFGLIRW